MPRQKERVPGSLMLRQKKSTRKPIQQYERLNNRPVGLVGPRADRSEDDPRRGPPPERRSCGRRGAALVELTWLDSVVTAGKIVGQRLFP